MRRQYLAGDLPYGPRSGDFINWAVFCGDGVDPNKAAKEAIIALTSDNHEIQEDVRRIVESVFI